MAGLVTAVHDLRDGRHTACHDVVKTALADRHDIGRFSVWVSAYGPSPTTTVLRGADESPLALMGIIALGLARDGGGCEMGNEPTGRQRAGSGLKDQRGRRFPEHSADGGRKLAQYGRAMCSWVPSTKPMPLARKKNCFNCTVRPLSRWNQPVDALQPSSRWVQTTP
jgi:hypothetical protein